MSAQLAEPIVAARPRCSRTEQPGRRPADQVGGLPGDGRGRQGAHPGRRRLPDRAVAAVRRAHRRPTRWTSTGCCGPPTRARTCTCCGCRPRTAHRSRSSGSSPEALVTVRDGLVTMHPIAGTRPRGAHRGGRRPAGQGPARRREGTQRARHARRPGPQRPRPGLRGRHREGRRVLHHRAVQPRHAHRLDGDRPAGRRAGPRTTRWRRASRPAPCPGRRSRGPCRSSTSSSRPAAACTGEWSATWTSPVTPTPRSPSAPRWSRGGTAYIQAGAGIVADSVPASEDAECQGQGGRGDRRGRRGRDVEAGR